METNSPINLVGKRGLHITHINARSIFRKIDVFRQFLSTSNISVCGVSETWLNEMVLDSMLEIPQYSMFRQDRGWSSENTNNLPKLWWCFDIYKK